MNVKKNLVFLLGYLGYEEYMFNIPFHRKACPDAKKCLTKKHPDRHLRNHRGNDS